MTAKVASVFKALAMRLSVSESDFLYLSYEDIHTSDDLYFRLPTAAKLEELLEKELFDNCAYENEGGKIEVFARSSLDGAPEKRKWLRSGDTKQWIGWSCRCPCSREKQRSEDRPERRS